MIFGVEVALLTELKKSQSEQILNDTEKQRLTDIEIIEHINFNTGHCRSR
mgnify:FL=1